MAGVLPMQIPGLHVHVERALAAAGLDADDAFHLGRRFEVLVVLCLVNEEVIDAQLIEHQPVVFLVLGEQVFQAFFSGGLLLLDGLDQVAVSAGGVTARAVAQQLLILLDLLPEELFLVTG